MLMEGKLYDKEGIMWELTAPLWDKLMNEEGKNKERNTEPQSLASQCQSSCTGCFSNSNSCMKVLMSRILTINTFAAQSAPCQHQTSHVATAVGGEDFISHTHVKMSREKRQWYESKSRVSDTVLPKEGSNFLLISIHFEYFFSILYSSLFLKNANYQRI